MRIDLQIPEWERQLSEAIGAGDLVAASKIEAKLKTGREIQNRSQIKKMKAATSKRQKDHNRRAHESLRGIGKGKPKDRDVAKVMRSEAKKRAAPWEGRGNRD